MTMNVPESGIAFCIVIGIVAVCALIITVWLDLSERRRKRKQAAEVFRERLEANKTIMEEMDGKFNQIIEALQPSPVQQHSNDE